MIKKEMLEALEGAIADMPQIYLSCDKDEFDNVEDYHAINTNLCLIVEKLEETKNLVSHSIHSTDL